VSPPPAPAVIRRRRLTAVAVVVGVLVVGGAIGVLTGGGAGTKVPAGLGPIAGGAPGSAPRTLVRKAARLPIERQVEQLFVVGLDGRSAGDPAFATLRAHAWGGIVLDRRNWASRRQISALAAGARAAARGAGRGAPLVVAAQDGGSATAFPGLPPRAQPTVATPHAAASEAAAAAAALRSLHVNMTLAPLADVGAEGTPFQDRVFSPDATQVASLTRTSLNAYLAAGIVPAVGHFPGQGSASQDPDRGTATVGLSLEDLRGRDLVPFRAIAARAPVIVVSNAVYAAYDGVTPAALVPDVVDGLLRGELGFRGVAMTDDLASAAPVLGQSSGEVAVDALRAGADLLYLSGAPGEQERAAQAVLAAVRDGRLSRDRLQQALLRVLALKARFASAGG
jgi:beta-N-acetylhexosaminidase